MQLRVLVLDYDGTVATDGVLDGEVRVALAQLRLAGTLVVLATGRILDELEHVAGDLNFVDAVVAENGCVVAFPADGRTFVLGHEPPSRFLALLGRRGVSFVAGQCVVEAGAADATAILAVIRELELPLTVAFNRSRLMVLPQGISKATGLHEALRLLRRSEHNALGIGDAENDHALLEACELGVAVAWGSRVLKAEADAILPGEGPAAVAGYVRELATMPQLPSPWAARRGLVLGHDVAGRPVTLAIRGRNVLVTGDARSGKSYVAGLLAEQLVLQRYAVCIIDPEGDYGALEDLPGVVRVVAHDAPPELEMVQFLVRHPELSLVIDLSAVPVTTKRAYVAALLPRLAAIRRQRGVPHRIVLDEAHYFLQSGESDGPLDWELGAYTLVTYRVSELPPRARSACPVVISTRLSAPSERRALLASGAVSVPGEQWTEELAELPVGEVLLLGGTDDPVQKAVRCQLASRLTTHVRHRQKYQDVPVSEAHAFVFTRDGVPTGECARTLGGLATAVRSAPAEVLAGHLRRGDISRWIADVFGDPVLAAQVRAVESRTSPDRAGEAGARLARLIAARYMH